MSTCLAEWIALKQACFLIPKRVDRTGKESPVLNFTGSNARAVLLLLTAAE